MIAVVVAAIAAFANFAYLNSVQDRAYKKAKRVQVFVVSKDISKGTPGETAVNGDYIKSSEIPQEFRPATAIPDTSSIRGKVAAGPLSVGQVVVDGMFVDPKVAQVTFSQRIPSGQVAITVSVDQVKGVAGLLVPGDKVNILVRVQPQGAGALEEERVLYQNVPIIAIGSAAAPQAGESAAAVNPGSGLITFAVPPTAASKIALVSTKDIYLTLVPPDNQPVPIPNVNANNAFGPELTPTG
ncbi:MAG TPA: Flp pilus assembly protein CpaB [Acidimicrobiales bacterium]|nr:Flp pilus assembly protein CpaB [Acidimicrobiales bacterium]